MLIWKKTEQNWWINYETFFKAQYRKTIWKNHTVPWRKLQVGSLIRWKTCCLAINQKFIHEFYSLFLMRLDSLYRCDFLHVTLNPIITKHIPGKFKPNITYVPIEIHCWNVTRRLVFYGMIETLKMVTVMKLFFMSFGRKSQKWAKSSKSF